MPYFAGEYKSISHYQQTRMHHGCNFASRITQRNCNNRILHASGRLKPSATFVLHANTDDKHTAVIAERQRIDKASLRICYQMKIIHIANFYNTQSPTTGIF
jgi:hypothetical protein